MKPIEHRKVLYLGQSHKVMLCSISFFKKPKLFFFFLNAPTFCCCSLFRLLSRDSLQLCAVDCSTPGFPVLHYLPEFAQVHVN